MGEQSNCQEKRRKYAPHNWDGAANDATRTSTLPPALVYLRCVGDNLVDWRRPPRLFAGLVVVQNSDGPIVDFDSRESENFILIFANANIIIIVIFIASCYIFIISIYKMKLWTWSISMW